MKNLIILSFLLFAGTTYAQDWNSWAFKFLFKINNAETSRYQYKNAEFFINDNDTYEKLRNTKLNFDLQTKEYTLVLNYGCISCGYPNSDLPPEIYLKINVDYPGFGVPFSSMIPIYFQKSESFKSAESFGNENIIDLGTIDIKHFITDNFWKDEVETYGIIEVRSPLSIHYLKPGKYVPRRMNRLIKLNLE